MNTWYEQWEAALTALQEFQEKSGSPMILAAMDPDTDEVAVVTVGTHAGIKETLWQTQRTIILRLYAKETE